MCEFYSVQMADIEIYVQSLVLYNHAPFEIQGFMQHIYSLINTYF